MKIVVFILMTSYLLSACTHIYETSQENKKYILSGEEYVQKLTDTQRIDLIRERRKELDSIRKGDFFLLNNNPEEALTYYLQVAEKLPDDVLLQKKIGHAYFLKKDWHNAYLSYIRAPIGELTGSERIELLNSLFFDESQQDRLQELTKLSIGTGELETYTIINTCYTGISNCISSIESYSGETITILNLQSSIKDAKTVSPDHQYRNFIVASKFYELGHFRVVAHIAREILQDRPGYTGVEKLLGFSLYEIGNYPEAQKYLLSYFERMPKDLETAVKLGDIAFKQLNYTTANLYYNNAILAGYTQKTNIERKLAYSYSKIGDMPSMMKVLAYLLEEKDVTIDDTAVAISLALQNGENIKAYVWASNALKKYPESSIIHSLYLTSLRSTGNFSEAQNHIDSLPESITKHPIILLEKAIILLEYDGDLMSARNIFESVRDVDPMADFALEAENYIQFIDNKKLILDQETVSSSNSWWQ